MAWMDMMTFDISQDNECLNDTCFFEVDDLIALPIQALNKKGYHTHASCEGHFFGTPNFYILFFDDVDLPYYPEGFTFEQCALRHENTRGSVYGHNEEKVNICARLSSWANSLPKFR